MATALARATAGAAGVTNKTQLKNFCIEVCGEFAPHWSGSCAVMTVCVCHLQVKCATTLPLSEHSASVGTWPIMPTMNHFVAAAWLVRPYSRVTLL